VQLVAHRSGILVSNTIDAGSDGAGTSFIFKLFGPFIRRSMRKQLLRELEGLKSILET
jgi:hypothetical protein